MPPWIERRLLPEALRLFAASQALPLVAVHAAWILLLAGNGGGEGVIRSFVWLGGVGLDGHGDETTLMWAWTRLAFVVYALDLALRALRGERAPIALWKLALGSAAVAALGIAAATRTHGLDAGERAFTVAFFALFAAGAAFWAVGLQRLAEQFARSRLADAAPRAHG